MLNRRGLITGLISLAVTAPSIVRAANLMPVKAFELPPIPAGMSRLLGIYGPHIRIGDVITFSGVEIPLRQFVITAIHPNGWADVGPAMTQEILGT